VKIAIATYKPVFKFYIKSQDTMYYNVENGSFCVCRWSDSLNQLQNIFGYPLKTCDFCYCRLI